MNIASIARLTAAGWEVRRRRRGALAWWRAEKRTEAGQLRVEVARSLADLEQLCLERDAREAAP